MNRRQFLKSAFFTTLGVAVLSACKKVTTQTKKLIEKVSTKKFDNIDISVIGFGLMRLPQKDGEPDIERTQEMVDYAIEHGINYFDTAWFYHGGKSELAAGKVLKKYPRNSYYLADKMPLRILKDKAEVIPVFEEQLEKCQTDYFDFYLAHNINKREWETLKQCNVYEQLLKKKQEGKIKYLGFSIHDTPELLEEVVKTYKWDFVQLPINPIDWDMVDAKKQYEIATKAGLPVVVMNPLKGGQLSSLNTKAVDLLKKENPDASASSWSLRYSASLPNVFTVLSGMTEIEHVTDNVKTFTNFKPLTEKEQSVLSNAISVYNSSGAISCTYCQYCTGCPVGIDIPKNFLIYNQYKATERKDRFVIAYESIKEENRADKCINCGVCKNKCPQKLDIPNLLKEMAKLYEELKK
ncbi:aldo/keto reductase [Candidatus Ruminimicrobium bovinum]|uniref:aldo/keto reductase n=1 Tax=Candidatus Ruminimicrobium bovinum TaxID=3242779 RepID=UPI0039B90BB4